MSPDRINVNTERRGERSSQQTQRGTTETDAALIEITETGQYVVTDWPSGDELARAHSFSIQGERGMFIEDPSPQAEQDAQDRDNVAVAFVETNVADPLNVRDLASEIRIDLRGVRR